MAIMESERYPITEEMEKASVVDVDFHLEPSVDKLLPYIDHDGTRRALEIEGYPPSTRVWGSSYATPYGGDGRRAHGVAETGEDVLEVMETLSLDTVLLTSGYNTIPDINNTVLKNELTLAYNEYVLEEVAPVDSNIKALPIIPQWNPELAREVIERHASHDSVAGFYGYFGHVNLLGNKEFDVMYDALVENDLALGLHSSDGGWGLDPIGESIQTWTEMYGIVNPIRAMIMVGNMILNGVFDKYPDLQIVLFEGGFNWAPFLGLRLDEIYSDHPEDIQLTERLQELGQEYLKKQPSEYLRENFAFSSQPFIGPKKPANMATMLEMMNAEENLMFASDFPHYTIDLYNWAFESSAIDDDLRENILRNNAENIFRI